LPLKANHPARAIYSPIKKASIAGFFYACSILITTTEQKNRTLFVKGLLAYFSPKTVL